MKSFKELDDELVKFKKEYNKPDNHIDMLDLVESLFELSESLIDLLNIPDEKPKLFKEWLDGFFQFYKDNGSNTSIAIVKEVENKFKEIFESES